MACFNFFPEQKRLWAGRSIWQPWGTEKEVEAGVENDFSPDPAQIFFQKGGGRVQGEYKSAKVEIFGLESDKFWHN